MFQTTNQIILLHIITINHHKPLYFGDPPKKNVPILPGSPPGTADVLRHRRDIPQMAEI